MNNDLKALSESRIFWGVDEPSLKKLSGSFIKKIKIYKKNETIYSEKLFDRSLCVILKGKAIVYKTNAEKRRIIMSKLGVSDCFGMAALFHEAGEFPTEVIAASECRTLSISKEQIIRAFEDCPQIAVNYATVLTERVHFMNRQIEALTCSDLKERLLYFLSTLPAGESGQIELPFSMLELAGMLNMGRASLYRTIAALTQEGLIKRNGKTIILRKEDDLS